jgi:hypothetical protein
MYQERMIKGLIVLNYQRANNAFNLDVQKQCSALLLHAG